MRIGLLGGGSAALAAALAIAVGGAPAAFERSAAKPFAAFASCGGKGKRADRFCFEGDRPVAVFRALERARVSYRVCFRRRGAQQRCKDRRTRTPGSRSRTRFDIDGSDHYQLAFFAAGRTVDRDPLVVRERSAFVIGDSLGQGTKPYIPRALPDWRVSQSVSISRHAPEGVSILRRRGSLPGAIVISLGTNDDPRSLGAFRSAVSGIVSIAGSTRCVVWPNIVRPPVGGASYAGYNRILDEIARRQPNLRVVDWARMVSRNRDWLAGDGVHVNAAGYQARANAIAKQVKRCLWLPVVSGFSRETSVCR